MCPLRLRRTFDDWSFGEGAASTTVHDSTAYAESDRDLCHLLWRGFISKGGRRPESCVYLERTVLWTNMCPNTTWMHIKLLHAKHWSNVFRQSLLVEIQKSLYVCLSLDQLLWNIIAAEDRLHYVPRPRIIGIRTFFGNLFRIFRSSLVKNGTP